MESNAFPSRSWLQRIHRDKHHKVDESGRTWSKEKEHHDKSSPGDC